MRTITTKEVFPSSLNYRIQQVDEWSTYTFTYVLSQVCPHGIIRNLGLKIYPAGHTSIFFIVLHAYVRAYVFTGGQASRILNHVRKFNSENEMVSADAR